MRRLQLLYLDDVVIYVKLMDTNTTELQLLSSTSSAAERQQAETLPSRGHDPGDRWLQGAGKLVLAGSQLLPRDLGWSNF